MVGFRVSELTNLAFKKGIHMSTVSKILVVVALILAVFAGFLLSRATFPSFQVVVNGREVLDIQPRSENYTLTQSSFPSAAPTPADGLKLAAFSITDEAKQSYSPGSTWPTKVELIPQSVFFQIDCTAPSDKVVYSAINGVAKEVRLRDCPGLGTGVVYQFYHADSTVQFDCIDCQLVFGDQHILNLGKTGDGAESGSIRMVVLGSNPTLVVSVVLAE